MDQACTCKVCGGCLAFLFRTSCNIATIVWRVIWRWCWRMWKKKGGAWAPCRFSVQSWAGNESKKPCTAFCQLATNHQSLTHELRGEAAPHKRSASAGSRDHWAGSSANAALGNMQELASSKHQLFLNRQTKEALRHLKQKATEAR